MYRAMLFAVVLAGAMATGPVMLASSASELLEKGIYTEETVGNLDEAISIYEKVVAEGEASHALAAQAQFRLGQCLLKKGKKAEATAAFEKLISNFADQKELVAKARKFVPEGIQLEPVPWVDGEALQLQYRLPGGLDIGSIVYTAQSAELDGRKIWRVGSRQLIVIRSIGGKSGVDADWNTFRPITSYFEMSPVGKFTVDFTPTELIVTTDGSAGKSTKKIDQTGVVYDNEQAMDVFRRLPLAVGYKTTVPILGIGGNKIELPMEVQGKEMVKVPAGEFECFKIHLGLVDQMFWYATDPHRYLVKFDANTVIAELTSIGQIKPGELRQYEDEKLGLSLAAPNDWFFYYVPATGEKGSATIYFLDPKMVSLSLVFVGKVADLVPESQKSLRAWADAVNAELGKAKKDFIVRPDSWREGKVAGQASLSYIADYTDGKRKMVDYHTFVRNESIVVQFVTSVPQDEFEEFRKQFDPIIDSLKVKQP
jgi:hypothetical protein